MVNKYSTGIINQKIIIIIKKKTTHTSTQRLIETRTDTNTDTQTCKHGNINIFHLDKFIKHKFIINN